METFGAVVAGALFWLPRIAVISLVLTAVIWAADKGMNWLVPERGDSAPEFEAGSADQNALYARLLQAEFTQIKDDLASGAATVNRLLQGWTTEFEETNRKKQSLDIKSAARPAIPGEANVISSEIRAPVDLARVSEVVENLKLLSSAITAAKVPDIKIASVELGPVLRWLVDMLRPASENKVVIFDESSAALVEGPIVSDGRIVLEFEPLTDQKKRTAREIVAPVAYGILASKLASTAKVDFGSWSALRDFVIGTKNLSKLVSQPHGSDEDNAEWNRQIRDAARLIERAGAAAQAWSFVALASFLFEHSKDFDNAIRVLDRYADFTRGNKKDESAREARLAYLRDRRVESAVASALESKQGDGTVFAVTAATLARLPTVIAARKLHRLDGAPDRTKVKIAIVGDAKPHWFGLDRPPDNVPSEGAFADMGANLALVVRALTPSADVVFVPIAGDKGTTSLFELLKALDSLIGKDIPVILLPFGPLGDSPATQRILEVLTQKDQLVVVSADGGFPAGALAAQAIDLDGKSSGFAPGRKEVLGAVGELPVVSLTEAGPTVFVGKFASAALAAVAVESVARQPTLKGSALRDALVKAATQPKDPKDPPIARVVIPR